MKQKTFCACFALVMHAGTTTAMYSDSRASDSSVYSEAEERSMSVSHSKSSLQDGDADVEKIDYDSSFFPDSAEERSMSVSHSKSSLQDGDADVEKIAVREEATWNEVKKWKKDSKTGELGLPSTRRIDILDKELYLSLVDLAFVDENLSFPNLQKL